MRRPHASYAWDVTPNAAKEEAQLALLAYDHDAALRRAHAGGGGRLRRRNAGGERGL